MEPHYNEILGTMKITLLYQVSHFISGYKNKELQRAGTSIITLLEEGFVISDLFITRFHCIIKMLSVKRALTDFFYSKSEIKTRLNNGTYKRTHNSSKKTESIAFRK